MVDNTESRKVIYLIIYRSISNDRNHIFTLWNWGMRYITTCFNLCGKFWLAHSYFINLDSIFFSLLLAREVEELLYGNEEKYKGTTTMGISLLNDTNGKQAKPKPASYAPISNRYLFFFPFCLLIYRILWITVRDTI